MWKLLSVCALLASAAQFIQFANLLLRLKGQPNEGGPAEFLVKKGDAAAPSLKQAVLSESLSKVLQMRDGARFPASNPLPLGAAAAPEEEEMPEVELAAKILEEGHAFFRREGMELSARESALNIARQLSMDPTHRYGREVVEISRLILSESMDSTVLGPVAASQSYAALEWAFKMTMDHVNDPAQSLATLLETVHSQKDETAKIRLKEAFLERYPSMRPEVEDQYRKIPE